MRTIPLSPHDQAMIIRQLARYTKWKGTRAGAAIQMVRLEGRILFSVKVKHRTVSDRAFTVGEAIAACNQLIQTRRPRELPVMMIPRSEWLPYREAEL